MMKLSAVKSATAVIVLAGAAYASGAWAQTVSSPSEFTRDRNISVTSRGRPGYEALGIHSDALGSIWLYPRLSVDAIADDNIYATTSAKTADTLFQINPEVAMKSDWIRHSLNVIAHGSFIDHAKESTENTNSYGVAATGRLDVVGRSYVYGGASGDVGFQARTDPTAPGAAAKPIEYDTNKFNIGGVNEINRSRFQAELAYSDNSYQNNRTKSGGFLRQDDRNYGELDATGRGEYAISPATSVFFTATANQKNYRLMPPIAAFNRDSSGYNVAVGTSFDITNLIRGEVQIGYLSQSYAQHGFSTVSAPSFNALVDWFPTQLTTVNFSASRKVQEPAETTASGFLASTAGVRVDHELLRNVVLSATTSYEQDAYQGLSRTDALTTAGASATYLMNHAVGLKLAFNYLQLNSSGAAHINSYSDDKVSVGLTLQF